MIGKIIALVLFILIVSGLGLHGTVSAMLNGYQHIASSPIVQDIKSDAVNMTEQEIKNEFYNSTSKTPWSSFGAGSK